MSDALFNRLSGDRIESRQVDEMIGIARGLIADGVLVEAEVEFLQRWLAANQGISDLPVVRILFRRVNEILADGVADADEIRELFDTLDRLSRRDFELGEVLKPTRLPLDSPAPAVAFPGRRFCFTGTFNFGQRRDCEAAVAERGGLAGSLTQAVSYLVVGAYATDSWKHSSFGNKIMQACEWRDAGRPIAIVSEEHWTRHL